MSYEELRLIWWALLGALLIGFAVMDGFDLGSAILSPFVARTDIERRQILNSIGPVWEGNQVWFILGGGAIFAAWPALYAASFSGFYLAMFAVLAALIFRPLAIVYRSKLPNPAWRAWWDWVLCATGLIPSIIFGVAFGNLFLGVPFTFDADLRFHSDITLLGLLSPFPLLVGLVSLSMIALHGATWLAMKTDGPVSMRATRLIRILAFVYLALFIVAGVWYARLDGYLITSAIDPNGPSNPMLKTVERMRWLFFSPGYAFASAFLAILGAAGAAWLRSRKILPFLCSALTCAATVATAGLALFPFLLPSSSEPNASLTVWDASSSQATLTIMLVVTAIFLPLIILYTSWVFRVMRGPVRTDDIANDHGAY